MRKSIKIITQTKGFIADRQCKEETFKNSNNILRGGRKDIMFLKQDAMEMNDKEQERIKNRRTKISI